MRNFFKFILLRIMLFLIRRKKRKIKKGTLLLIRLDAIGDYIMFRNFIYALKKTQKYKNYDVTLCGNIAWKDLAENFDREAVSNFIWMDRLKFLNDANYKYHLLQDIYLRGYEAAIETIHSREILFGDAVIAASSAAERIGSRVTDKFHKFKKGIFSDNFYTRLIPVSGEVEFEFNRTKNFFNNLLGYEVDIRRPQLNSGKLRKPLINRKYIVLFPGASKKEKMWPAEGFRKTAEYIVNKTNYIAAAAGSESEKYLGEMIRPPGAAESFLNLCGGSLTELAGIIAGADLLITNDTSAVHLSAAAGRPFICIANGFYFGRFYPYPEDVYDKGYYLYPKNFVPGINGDLNSVSPEEVIFLMNRILKLFPEHLNE